MSDFRVCLYLLNPKFHRSANVLHTLYYLMHFTCGTANWLSAFLALYCLGFGTIVPAYKRPVIAPDVGGGFMSKINIYPEDIPLPLGVDGNQSISKMDVGLQGGVPHRYAGSRTC